MKPSRLQIRLAIAVALAGLTCVSALHAGAEVKEAPAGSLAVRGVVEASYGSRLTESRIELLSFPSLYEAAERRLNGVAPPAAVVISGADDSGRFTLEAPFPGVYQLKVEAPGSVPMRFAPLVVTGTVELPPLTLVEDVGCGIEFLDKAGRSAQGIYVSVVEGRRPSFWERSARVGWRPWPRRAKTGSKDRVRFARGRGEALEVTWLVDGDFVPRQAQWTGGRNLELPPAEVSRTMIEVREPSGAPMGGVMVAVGTNATPVGATGLDGQVALRGRLKEPISVLLLHADGRRLETRLEPGARLHLLTLPAPSSIQGSVKRAASGKPIPGAVVWPLEDPGRATTSGGDGRFGLPYASVHRLWLQAEATGYLPWARPLRGDRKTPVQFSLEAAATASGQVVDGEGRPIAGVQVVAVNRSEDYPDPRAFHPDRAAGRSITDSEGRFFFGRLFPAGSFLAWASRPGLLPAQTVFGGLKPGARRNGLRLVLERARSTVGRVVDAMSQPVEGAEIRLGVAREMGLPTDPARKNPQFAHSGPDGRFRLDQVPMGALDLAVGKKGFAPLSLRGLEVPPGDGPADLGTLTLEAGAAIEGIVSDGTQTLAGVSVWLSTQLDSLAGDRLREEPSRTPDAETDEAGRFLLQDLPEGKAFHLLFRRSGFLPAVREAVKARPGEPLRVVLNEGRTLQGEVLDVEGRPIVGARVAVRLPESRVDPLEVPLRGPEHSKGAITAEDGGFLIEGVAAGRFEVSASASGFVASEPQELVVGDEEPVAPVTLVLARGATIEGQALLTNGEPVAEVHILVAEASGVSDSDGLFRVEGVRAGLRRLEARHPIFRRVTQEADIGDGVNVINFILEEGHEVSGMVVDEEGLAVADASVILDRRDPRDPHHLEVMSGGDGGFRFPAAARGDYLLEVAKAGFAPSWPLATRVGSRPSEDVEVVLIRGRSIAGRLLGLQRAELASIQVEARDRGGRSQSGEANAEGLYRIADLGTGDWLARAWLPGEVRQAEARVVVSRDDVEVWRDLDFGDGATLHGSVLLGEGPLAGARVEVSGQDVAAGRQVMTDHEGRFRVEGLEKGSYRIGVSHAREYVVHNRDIVLAGDAEIVIRIDAQRVSGTVISSADSSPIADAVVAIKQLLPGGRQGSLFAAASDAEGFFGFARVTAGRFAVTVQRDGFAAVERELEITPGADVGDLFFRLTPTEGLVLRPRLEFGGVPPHVTAFIAGSTGSSLVHQIRAVDDDGLVRFPSVPDGTWQVTLSAPGGAPLEMTATIPAEPLDIVFPVASRLSVRVPDLVESHQIAKVILFGADGQAYRGVSEQGLPTFQWRMVSGVAAVDGVPRGPWLLQVEAQDGRLWAAPVTPTETEVQVNLE